MFNGGISIVMTVYALVLGLPLTEIEPLFLIAVLASIPVALPSMFTLAATVGVRHLAGHGILPTRLSSLDEAAGVDCAVCRQDRHSHHQLTRGWPLRAAERVRWIVLSSVVDVGIIVVFASFGILMAPLSILIICGSRARVHP